MTDAERRHAALVVLDAAGVEGIDAMLRDRPAIVAVLAAWKAATAPATADARDTAHNCE